MVKLFAFLFSMGLFLWAEYIILANPLAKTPVPLFWWYVALVIGGVLLFAILLWILGDLLPWNKSRRITLPESD